jgi:protein TBF1
VLPVSSSAEDPITKATLAAHAAISGQHTAAFETSGFHSPTTLHTPSFSALRHSHKRKRSSASGGSGDSSTVSPNSPAASMHLQYEHARVSSHPKSTTPFNSRRMPGTPSTRRPWTQDEEKALMDGLERVKGPHWSQILALYGAGGSISEVLKDRNQVQLKDKARNLKLFFLKSGIDVPVYLQRVTGELKTRAPAQAAKMEARERLKQLEEEKVKRGIGGDDKRR